MVPENYEKMIREMLFEVCQIWSWTFSYDFELCETNCMSPNLFTKIMLEDKHMEALSGSEPGDAPLVLSNTMGLMLSAASCNNWWMSDILGTSDFAKEQSDIRSPGHNQVFFLPYLMGERSPHNDPSARGAFIGMSMDTTRAGA